jgi:predicted transglutaminase-like cysteine proteinase
MPLHPVQLHSVGPKISGWLIAAVLLYPQLSFATQSRNVRPMPVRPEHMLVSLPPLEAPQQPRSDEPFGPNAIPVTSGDWLDRWRVVQNQIDAEAAIIDRCLAQQECPPAARKFLDIVAQGRGRTGLAQVGVINRAVNLAIAPESDIEQWGVDDLWSPPLETLTTGHGDCEDYAIAKYAALLRAGMSEDDVRLIIVQRRLPDEEHAVAAARIGEQWFILDNRTQILAPDTDMRGVTPLVVLDADGAKTIVPGSPATQWAADPGKARSAASIVNDVLESAKSGNS